MYKNFFQPTMKLAEKVRVEGKIHRKYDQPKTPYQRLIESGQISAAARKTLMVKYESLNVAALRRRVEELRNQLFDHLSAKELRRAKRSQTSWPRYSCWRSSSCYLDEEETRRAAAQARLLTVKSSAGPGVKWKRCRAVTPSN